MNKLEEYKHKVCKKVDKKAYDKPNFANSELYMLGFDAAIALDLESKFYLWATGSSESYSKFVKEYLKKHGENGIPLEDKVKFWRENIYKPE